MTNSSEKSLSLPEIDGHISITPYGAGDIAPDILSALQNPELNTTQSQKFADTPPLVFLDATSRCEQNSKDIALAARTLFGNNTGHAPLLVGLSGFQGFYLPNKLKGLEHQAKLAATAAAQMGRLGEGNIIMLLKRSVRPAPENDWHEDLGNTFLLCASKVSCVVALTGAELGKGRKVTLGDEPQLMSPLAGMPIAMGRILHSRPYEMFPNDADDDESPSPTSSMLVFYEMSNNRSLDQQPVSAAPFREAIRARNGYEAAKWNYGA